MHPLDVFSAPTRQWFTSAFAEPTPVQLAAWPVIQSGTSVLAVAPTGSGKTLAAFLWAIDQCLRPDAPSGVKVLYVSPLKALAVDVQRNLRGPLAGITAQLARSGDDPPEVSVGLRTGDTTARERASMLRHPPDVLITTPESLFLLLTSQGRTLLRDVQTVIVDEVHAIAGSKRGSHLAVSLARLDHEAGRRIPRIGLSATIEPAAEAARFLGGDQHVEVVSGGASKTWDLEIQVPVEDMSDLAGAARDGEPSASIWPHVENRIVDLIETHRSTIVFANSRRLAERLTARLNEIHAERTVPPDTATPPETGSPQTAAGRPPAQAMGQAGATLGAPPALARAHHGSVSKDQRALIEDDLKTGRLRAVVATSSLELGIDMGAVDLVIQVEAPPSVASGLQRVGRAGHQVGAVSEGVVLPKHRADLLASAVVVQRMRAGQIETLRVPANPLDVAAQQVVAMVAMDPWHTSDLYALLRRTSPFRDLTLAVYESVLDMLAGRYPSDAFAELKPRIVWDRASDMLTARPGAQRLAVTSGGTIPDRGLFAVHVAGGGGRVGELDEEMVYESRVGDVIALGASSWQIVEITHDRVHVVPQPGAPGRLPFWRGDALGRPAELGRAIGTFARELAGRTVDEGLTWLAERSLDPLAARALVGYVHEQAETGQVATDRTIVVERTRDELGDWRIAVLSPFGARVHAPWALLARHRLQERFGVDASVSHGDDGLVARLPDLPDDEWVHEATACLFPDPEEVEPGVTGLIGSSALFASRFRECASRALLLPRLRPGRRAPLWQQRQRSAQLLQVAAEHPTFPIVLEAVRECVQDVFDLPALVDLMAAVQRRSIRVVEDSPAQATPFARSLLFGYVAEFLYEGDTPLAERRAAALTLDPTLLGELLGQADLRELLEPAAIEAVVAQLQHLTPERRARDLEDAADLLRVLGPLSVAEGERRGVEPDWWVRLAEQRRILPTRIAGRDVWAAVEDAPRLRDALGAPLPPGLPEAHLEPVADPLADLVSRYARTHGPFTTADVVAGMGLAPAVTDAQLRSQRASGRLLEGRFLADAPGTQWCHPDVLRLIKRRSVALLRQQIEPVAQPTLAAFLPSWQRVHVDPADRLRGPEGLLEVSRILAGVPLPLASLESSVLPLRVADYRPELLDELTASGEIVWTGHGSLPGGDGWIVLAPAGLDPLLPRSTDVELSAPARTVLDLLQNGGGWSAADLSRRLGGATPSVDVSAALADLLWAGLVSNDTLAPVRVAAGRGAGRARARRSTGGSQLDRRLPGARAPRGRYADLMRASRATHAQGLGPGAADGAARSAGAAVMPSVPGRWFALPDASLSVEQTSLLRAEAQLDRWGVVTRGAVAAGGEVGGFAGVYRTLRMMEDRGRVQRVYAVEGLGAAQFALPGVVDELRDVDRAISEGAPPTLVLAAADPANAYGAALEWPASDWAGAGAAPHRPARASGSHVVLHGGRLAVYVERGGRSMLTFGLGEEAGSATPPIDVAQALEALVVAVHQGRVPALTVTRINGLTVLDRPAAIEPVAQALLNAGAHLSPRGLRVRRDPRNA